MAAVFEHFGDAGEFMYLSGILDRAFYYAALTVKPDGTLPLVGDSILVRPGLSRQYQLPAFEYFRYAVTGGRDGRRPPTADAVFPIAGYALFRDRWHPEESFSDGVFILFKCGFLSQFHRQDDDLSFVVSALGEDWFVDSGRFSYQETDPLRLYMRSPVAHNVPVPKGSVPVRSLAQLRPGTGISAYGLAQSSAYVEGRTTIHPGIDLTRRLEYDKPFNLRITDTLTPLDGAPRPAWGGFFQIPADKRIEVVKPGEIALHSRKGNSLKVTYPISANVRIESGCDEPIQGCRSERMGQAEPIQTLILDYPAALKRSVVDLELIPITATAAPAATHASSPSAAASR